MLRSCIIAILVSVTLLSGCASLSVMRHVPLATMSRLSSLKVSDIDPEQLRIAAQLPLSLEPLPQGVKVQLDVSGARQTSSRHASFILEPGTQAAELSPLAAWEHSGARLWLYRLSPADVVRVRAIMSDALPPSGGSHASISVAVDACHRGPLAAALPTTTLLRVNASGYLVLVENLDLRSIVPDADLAAKIPACVGR